MPKPQIVTPLNPKKVNHLSNQSLTRATQIKSKPSLQIHGTHLERRFNKSDDDLIKIAVDMTHI